MCIIILLQARAYPYGFPCPNFSKANLAWECEVVHVSRPRWQGRWKHAREVLLDQSSQYDGVNASRASTRQAEFLYQSRGRSSPKYPDPSTLDRHIPSFSGEQQAQKPSTCPKRLARVSEQRLIPISPSSTLTAAPPILKSTPAARRCCQTRRTQQHVYHPPCHTVTCHKTELDVESAATTRSVVGLKIYTAAGGALFSPLLPVAAAGAVDDPCRSA